MISLIKNHQLFKYCFLLLVFCVFSLPTQAKTTPIPSLPVIDMSLHKSGQSTLDHYVYLKDSTQKLTITDVVKMSSWKTPLPEVVNRGHSDAPSWMKFTLKNPTEQSMALILEYIDASAQSIDIYYRELGSNNEFKQQNFTFNQPIVTRPISFYRPAFHIDLPKQTGSEVYVRIFQGNEFPMHSFTRMRIWQEVAFYRAAHVEMLFLILLIFTEIFMGIATLAVFFSTKDKLFLYYTFFAFSAASLFSGTGGLWGYFLTPNNFELWMVVLQINVCQIASILFIRHFLNVRQLSPFIDKLLLTVLWIDILGVVLNLFGEPYFSRIIIDYTAFVYILFVPLGLYAYKRAVNHALLFTFSWLVFAIGMALSSLRYRGYIADTSIAEWSIYVGGFIEAFLLSTIMILRIIDMRKEKLAMEVSIRKSLEESALVLTKKVNEQTLQLQDAIQKAEQEARTDLLTGLANRRSFFELAVKSIDRAKRREPSNLHLMMIDIDNFKKINDTFGHAAGDEALKNIANVLTNTLRTVDLVSRIGGEEFVVIIEDSDINGASELGNRLLQAVSQTQTSVKEHDISLTISIGLATWEIGDSLHDLMKKADEALYKAKKQGRNCMVLNHLNE